MSKTKSIIFLLVVIFIQACQQEAEIQPKEYPFIISEEVKDIDSRGVTLNAEILNRGTEIITDLGFAIRNNEDPSIEGRIVSLKKNLNSSKLHARIENDLLKNNEYSVRAYVQTENTTVYSNAVSFQSEGCQPPEIFEFDPQFSKPGVPITIAGNQFSELRSNNNILFGAKQAEVIYSTIDTLIVLAPSTTKNQITNISVEVADQNAVSSTNFDLRSPWKRLPDFPGGTRNRSTYFTIGNKGYITLGGLYYPDLASTELWEYDNDTQQWDAISIFPGEPRTNAIGFSIGDMGYIGLGKKPGSVTIKDLWRYDPANNNWNKMADLPSDKAFGYAPHIVVNNKLYIYLRGQANIYFNNLPELWEYDPESDRWTKLAEPRELRQQLISDAVKIGNTSYFIGANKNDINFWTFDSSDFSFSQVRNIPKNSYLSFFIHFGIGNKLYMHGHKLTEYELKGDHQFHNENVLEPNPLNLQFIFGNKAILSVDYTNIVYEFSPE